MNFLELQNKVIQKLKERSTPKHWTADEIKDNVNRGCKKFAAEAMPRLQRLPLYPVDLPTGKFAFPDDILKMKAIYWNDTKLNFVDEEYLDNLYSVDAPPMVIGSSPESRQNWRSAIAENPTHCLIDDGYVRLYPIPQATVSAVSLRKTFEDSLSVGETDIVVAGPLPINKNLVDVFVNGVGFRPSEWEIINSTTIRLNVAVNYAADCEVVSFDGVTSANTTTFKYSVNLPAGTQAIIMPRPYIVGDGAISLKVNGISQAPSTFTESSVYSITLNVALVSDSHIEVTLYERPGAFPATIRCQRIPVKMVNDTDQPDLPSHLEDYHDAIWSWALVECYSREGQEKDMGMANFYAGLFKEKVSEYKQTFGTAVLIAPREAWRI